MKQTISSAALCVMPNSGHAINIEEPDDITALSGIF